MIKMPYFNAALKLTLVAVCCLYLSAAQAAAFSGKVVAIADGDTLTVLTRKSTEASGCRPTLSTLFFLNFNGIWTYLDFFGLLDGAGRGHLKTTL
jgi:hypothetical protein